MCEVKLKNGRTVYEGKRLTLSDMRQMGRKEWRKRFPGPVFFVTGKDKGKLSYFWDHVILKAKSGPNLGGVVNPDSGIAVLGSPAEQPEVSAEADPMPYLGPAWRSRTLPAPRTKHQTSMESTVRDGLAERICSCLFRVLADIPLVTKQCDRKLFFQLVNDCKLRGVQVLIGLHQRMPDKTHE